MSAMEVSRMREEVVVVPVVARWAEKRRKDVIRWEREESESQALGDAGREKEGESRPQFPIGSECAVRSRRAHGVVSRGQLIQN